MKYRGRFAPSPTGPLHFGSLVAAVASFLDARKNAGAWLVRIEDIDPPREVPGATKAIFRTLEAHRLLWDEEPVLQSLRSPLYLQALDALIQQNTAYHCICTRSQIAIHGQRAKDGGWIYPGTCRDKKIGLHGATRLRVDDSSMHFTDAIQGEINENIAKAYGDFVLQRADGLFAYQLAVVVDDYEQGISHVVRGSDLLDSTTRQLFLQRQLGYPSPSYVHVPIAIDDHGEKLSKQTFATAIDNRTPARNLWLALRFLRQDPPEDLGHSTPEDLLQWATSAWNASPLRGIRQLAYDAV